MVKPKVDRNEQVWEMTLQHYTDVEISKELDISRQRVHQIREQHISNMRIPPREAQAMQHRAQLDACISEVAERLEGLRGQSWFQGMAELRKWMDMRFRVYGEFAPIQQRFSLDRSEEPVQYVIGGDESITKALR